MGFKLQFADKEITARDGMGLLKRMLDRIGFESVVLKNVDCRTRAVTEAMHRFS